MQINPVSSYNYNNKPATNFKGIAKVSNVIMNDLTVPVKYPKFRSIIDKAIKLLKAPENKDMEFVKKFWNLMESSNSSTMLKRTGAYMVSGRDAQELENAAMDIKFYGDTSAYKDTKSDFINSRKHVKSGGVEQEIFIKSHLDKKKRIVIDEVGFKNKGQSMRSHDASKKDTVPMEVPATSLETKRPPIKPNKPAEKSPISTIPDWPAKIQEQSDVANATLIDDKGQNLFKF